MELQQIAKRAATKRNNRVKRELPLLAATDAIPAEFFTTQEEQQARIEKQRDQFEVWWEGLKELDQDFLRRAAAYREAISKLVTAGELAALDEQADRPWRKRNPTYLADFWHCRLHDLTGEW